MYFDCLIDSLSLSEQNLVKELYPYVKRVVTNFSKKNLLFAESSPYDTTSEYTRKISYYKEKINRIVGLLSSSDQKLEIFFKNLISLKKERNQSVEKLRDISQSIITVQMVSNRVRIIAGAIGFVGGLATIGSLLFPTVAPRRLPDFLGGANLSHLLPSVFRPAPTESFLAIAGAAATSVHAALNGATCALELALTELRLTDADRVITKDRRLLEQMGVFEFFDELNDAIDDLFDATISSRILSDLIDFLKKVPQHLFGIEYFLPDALFLCLSSILPNITEFLLIGTSLASVILSILFAVVLTWRRVCPILKHRLTLSLVYADDARMGIAELITSGLEVFKPEQMIFRTLTAKTLIGAIVTAGIALDITCIINNFIDLERLKKCMKERFSPVVTIRSTVAVVNDIPCNVDHQPNVQHMLSDYATVCTTVPTLPTDGNYCQSGFCVCPRLSRIKGDVKKCVYGLFCLLPWFL